MFGWELLSIYVCVCVRVGVCVCVCVRGWREHLKNCKKGLVEEKEKEDEEKFGECCKA